MKRLLLLSIFLGLLGFVPGLTELARADCGPGPIVTQKNKKSLWQSLGASTNATFLPTQTFSITTGTSGCSNSGVIKKEYEQRLFVAVHMDNIQRQMARGQGAHLDALASLLGCRTEYHGHFAGMTRHKLGLLLPADAPEESEIEPARLLARLKAEMRADRLLAGGCSRIS